MNLPLTQPDPLGLSLPLFIWVLSGQKTSPSHLNSFLFSFFLLSRAFVFTIALALSSTFCLSCQINMRMTGEPRAWGITLSERDGSVCVRAPAPSRGCWERAVLWKLNTDGGEEIWFCLTCQKSTECISFCFLLSEPQCSPVRNETTEDKSTHFSINMICGKKNPNRSKCSITVSCQNVLLLV